MLVQLELDLTVWLLNGWIFVWTCFVSSRIRRRIWHFFEFLWDEFYILLSFANITIYKMSRIFSITWNWCRNQGKRLGNIQGGSEIGIGGITNLDPSLEFRNSRHSKSFQELFKPKPKFEVLRVMDGSKVEFLSMGDSFWLKTTQFPWIFWRLAWRLMPWLPIFFQPEESIFFITRQVWPVPFVAEWMNWYLKGDSVVRGPLRHSSIFKWIDYTKRKHCSIIRRVVQMESSD